MAASHVLADYPRTIAFYLIETQRIKANLRKSAGRERLQRNRGRPAARCLLGGRRGDALLEAGRKTCEKLQEEKAS